MALTPALIEDPNDPGTYLIQNLYDTSYTPPQGTTQNPWQGLFPTQIVWGTPGSRLYEVGLDRGVLYLEGKTGVPWVGLKGVTESPDGGEATPYYIDGIKYLNLATPEEFQGTIEAYTYPDEFAECDGSFALGGLSAHQQFRKPFNLSYRTLVGNDTEGDRFGYKLHLVYNVLAGPSDRDYTSTSDEVELMAFSWDFTTSPIVVDAELPLRPVSHLTVDSRTTSPVQLRLIEEFLYGTPAQEARFLPIEQLFDWFINIPTAMVVAHDPETGLSPIVTSDHPYQGDLLGSVDKGLFRAPIETRLNPTSEPGLLNIMETV